MQTVPQVAVTSTAEKAQVSSLPRSATEGVVSVTLNLMTVLPNFSSWRSSRRHPGSYLCRSRCACLCCSWYPIKFITGPCIAVTVDVDVEMPNLPILLLRSWRIRDMSRRCCCRAERHADFHPVWKMNIQHGSPLKESYGGLFSRRCHFSCIVGYQYHKYFQILSTPAIHCSESSKRSFVWRRISNPY